MKGGEGRAWGLQKFPKIFLAYDSVVHEPLNKLIVTLKI